MAYDGPLLTAALIQAMASIPGSIKNIKDLLSRSKSTPENDAALQRLEELRLQLMNFQDTNGWLEEAKYLHEHLQSLWNSLEPLRALYRQAIKDGRFNAQLYVIADARSRWEDCKMFSFNRLLSIAGGIQRVETSALKFDNEYNFISGPEWGCRLIKIYTNIDQLFRKYDANDISVIVDIADHFTQLDRHVSNHSHLLDERIRKEASEFATRLSSLSEALKNV